MNVVSWRPSFRLLCFGLFSRECTSLQGRRFPVFIRSLSKTHLSLRDCAIININVIEAVVVVIIIAQCNSKRHLS